jgi:hypothetical protein
MTVAFCMLLLGPQTTSKNQHFQVMVGRDNIFLGMDFYEVGNFYTKDGHAHTSFSLAWA